MFIYAINPQTWKQKDINKLDDHLSEFGVPFNVDVLRGMYSDKVMVIFVDEDQVAYVEVALNKYLWPYSSNLAAAIKLIY